MRRMLLVFALALVAPGTGATQDTVLDTDGVERATEPPRDFGNLRLGFGTANENGLPVICLELNPLTWLAIEGCGTGSGFLHTRPGREIAHFRAKGRFYTWQLDQGWLSAWAGAGLAELEVGEDRPGLKVNPAAGSTAAAGPEWAAGAQWIFALPSSFELVVDGSVGVAYIPAAGRLVDPQDRAQPFAGLSVGLGW